jgi:hypothetical protein
MTGWGRNKNQARPLAWVASIKTAKQKRFGWFRLAFTPIPLFMKKTPFLPIFVVFLYSR